MAKIGDSVKVQIRGAPNAGTSVGSITVGAGAMMSVPGRIVEDLGEHWLVELSLSIGGKNRITIPKSAQMTSG